MFGYFSVIMHEIMDSCLINVGRITSFDNIQPQGLCVR